MNDPERPEQDNSVEVVDLDAAEAADHPESSWAKRRALLWQRSLTRQRARLLSWLGLIALLSIVVLASVSQGWLPAIVALFSAPSRSAPNAGAPPVSSITAAKVLLPQKAGLVCLADAAWSPDSRLLAVTGYERTCLDNGFPNGPGSLIIYDARSGRLVRHMAMDDLILATFHRLFPRDQHAPILDFQKVLWSPDGKRLVLPFAIIFSQTTLSGIQLNIAYSGILLLDANGAHPQVFLRQFSDFALAEWDTLRGQQVQASTGQSPFVTGSLAMAYRWGNGGTLLPFNQAQHALDPIGNPAGGQTFAVWQPGSLEISPPYSGPDSQQSAMYYFNTFFCAWSPDGRYFAIITIQAHILVPGQPQSAPNISNTGSVPNLNAREHDLAFQRALGMITGALVPSNLIMLSWRLDGRALAVYNASTTELEILDCATGDQTASLLLSTGVPPGQLNGPSLLDWSPDGARLLMFDPDVGDILIWNVR